MHKLTLTLILKRRKLRKNRLNDEFKKYKKETKILLDEKNLLI